MISSRCRGLNLLNHLKQKYDCKVEYEQIKDSKSCHYYEWLVKVEFNNRVYEVISKQKKGGLIKIMDSALEDIHNVINPAQ